MPVEPWLVWRQEQLHAAMILARVIADLGRGSADCCAGCRWRVDPVPSEAPPTRFDGGAEHLLSAQGEAVWLIPLYPVLRDRNFTREALSGGSCCEYTVYGKWDTIGQLFRTYALLSPPPGRSPWPPVPR
eukprot:1200678-Prymnesium_polylepis.1